MEVVQFRTYCYGVSIRAQIWGCFSTFRYNINLFNRHARSCNFLRQRCRKGAAGPLRRAVVSQQTSFHNVSHESLFYHSLYCPHPILMNQTCRFMIFYSATMPFLSVLHAFIDLLLRCLSMFSPIYALIASVVFICGWLTQWSIWVNCEASTLGLEYGNCPQKRLQYLDRNEGQQRKRDSYKGPPPVGIDGAKSDARIAFGFLVIVSYLVVMAWAAVKIHRTRIERKRGGALPLKEVISESASASA